MGRRVQNEKIVKAIAGDGRWCRVSYTIIGIDISLTGTAIAGKYWHGFQASLVDTVKLSGVDRLSAIAAYFEGLMSYADYIQGIFVEGLAYGSLDGKASERHYLYWHLIITAKKLGLNVVSIPPTTLKKFATGKGNAQKDQMMLACYKLTGYDPKDNNEADAVLLAHFGEVYMGLKEPKNQAQREAVEALRNPKPKKKVKRG